MSHPLPSPEGPLPNFDNLACLNGDRTVEMEFVYRPQIEDVLRQSLPAGRRTLQAVEADMRTWATAPLASEEDAAEQRKTALATMAETGPSLINLARQTGSLAIVPDTIHGDYFFERPFSQLPTDGVHGWEIQSNLKGALFVVVGQHQRGHSPRQWEVADFNQLARQKPTEVHAILSGCLLADLQANHLFRVLTNLVSHRLGAIAIPGILEEIRGLQPAEQQHAVIRSLGITGSNPVETAEALTNLATDLDNSFTEIRSGNDDFIGWLQEYLPHRAICPAEPATSRPRMVQLAQAYQAVMNMADAHRP